MVLLSMFDRTQAIAFLRVQLRQAIMSWSVAWIELDYLNQRLNRVIMPVLALLQLRQLKCAGQNVGSTRMACRSRVSVSAPRARARARR